MNKYIKLAACALAVFGLAACSEEKIANVDVTAIPQVSDYADCFAVTVDQETNNATFTFTGEGVYPVWIVDGKSYSSAPSITRYYRKKGEYSVEAKVGNANGISDGAINLGFTIDKTIMNGFGGFVFENEHNLWLTASKKINACYYAPGWAQIADPAVNLTDEAISISLTEATTDQWQCQIHIGTDICLQAGEHYDGSLIFTTTKDLTAGVVKIHPDGDDDDNHSFFPNAKIKTTANEPVTFWFSDLEANVDMNNLVITLDFGGNPENVDITIENFVLKNHIYDDGTELPVVPTTPEPDWVAVDSPDNLWGANHTYTTYYAHGDSWEVLPDPVVTQDGTSYTIELPTATNSQWQAQFALMDGPALAAGQAYDIKVEIETNVDLPAATFKYSQADDDNNFFFAETVAVPAGPYTFWQANVTAADMARSKYVFDFGGNPDGTVVTIKSIIVQKHLE